MGQLPLDLVDKDRTLAGKIAPEFFSRSGEVRQFPAGYVEAVRAITLAVNCTDCRHPHLLVAPGPTTTNATASLHKTAFPAGEAGTQAEAAAGDAQ